MFTYDYLILTSGPHLDVYFSVLYTKQRMQSSQSLQIFFQNAAFNFVCLLMLCKKILVNIFYFHKGIGDDHDLSIWLGSI